MSYVPPAYLLARLSKDEPTAEDVRKILACVGVETDEHMLSLFFESIKGKTVDELLQLGKQMFVQGGAAAAAGASQVATPGNATVAVETTEAPVQKEKEEKEEKEDKEEEEEGGFGGLFDD